MLNRILGALGWMGVALVFAGVAVRFLLPEQQELWYWLAVAGLVLVVAHTATQWREILAFAGQRQARAGAIATTGIVLALGIVVAANFILSRQNRRWDLTAAQQYSLSDQTRRVVESLESPVNVLVFAREAEFPRYRDRFDEYQYISSQVEVEYIDVDQSPARARQYEVDVYGTVIFEYEGRIERTTTDTEQELTNALIKVVEGEERTVYFVQGHGEADPEGDQRDGYRAVTGALERDNFRIETIVLAQATEVPRTPRLSLSQGPTPTCCRARPTCCATIWKAAASCFSCLTRPRRTTTRRSRTWRRSPPNGVSRLATTWWSMRAASANSSEPTRRCPSPPRIRRTPSRRTSPC